MPEQSDAIVKVYLDGPIIIQNQKSRDPKYDDEIIISGMGYKVSVKANPNAPADDGKYLCGCWLAASVEVKAQISKNNNAFTSPGIMFRDSIFIGLAEEA